MDSEPKHDSHDVEGTAAASRRRAPAIIRVMRGIVLVCVLLAICVAGGFIGFVAKVAAVKVPDPSARGDAIVALTGDHKRIDLALDLLRRGVAPRLLISGVNPATTGSEIRELTKSSKALFSCCVDIGHDAIDTIGNAYETARWIRGRGYRHVFLVTNNYHMPRSLMELHRVDPETDFIPYPVINADLSGSAWLDRPTVVRHLLSEYVKYTLSGARNLLGATSETGLRPHTRGTVISQAGHGID